MKGFITERALTDVIIEREIEVNKNHPNIMTCINHLSMVYIKPDWHDNEEDAINYAKLLRLNEIERLEKELVRMKQLRFTSANIVRQK